MEKKNKKIKFSKKLIAASLLVAVVLVNCIYSSFQQVAAQGRFENVDKKIEDIETSNGTLKVLEILPDEASLSVMEMLIGINSNSPYAFQELIKDYDNKKMGALANMLSQYGIINLDSTSSAIYPLTYYKPGDEERLYSNVPSLPDTDEYGGYALVERQLVVGSFEEVDKYEVYANANTGAEKVYYQEILPEEVSPSTPSEISPSTPTKGEETPYFINEGNQKILLKYKEEGFNQEIYDGTEAEGRFFRFVADAAEGGTATVDETSSQSYTGYGYRFVFGSKAQIKSNKLFTRFVLGKEGDVTDFNKDHIQLKTVTVEQLGDETYGINLAHYDLVYISNPFLKYNATDDILELNIKPHDFANANLDETETVAKYSQWVMLDMAGTRNADYMLNAATKLLEGAVNESAPLKLIVDSSILKDYEKAVINMCTGTC